MLSSFCRRVSEEEQRNVNNFCSIIHRAPAIQIQPLIHIHTHTRTHTHTHTGIIKSREGESEERRRQTATEEKQMRDGGWRMESCVLNIPSLILLCPGLSSSSWLTIRGAEREKASDKDNKDEVSALTAVVLLFIKFATAGILVVRTTISVCLLPLFQPFPSRVESWLLGW